MNLLDQVLSPLPNFQRFENQFTPRLFTSSHSSQRVTKIEAGSLTSADFTIVTAEGDKVTLSANSAQGVLFQQYTAQGPTTGLPIHVRAEEFSAFSTSEFQISVEGALSEQEAADIERFLVATKNIVSSLLRGEIDEAVAQTTGLGTLDNLTSAELEVVHISSLLVEQQTVQEGSLDLPEKFPDPTNSQVGHSHSVVNRTIEAMLQAVRDLQIDSAKLGKRLPQLLTRLFQSFMEDPRINEPQQSLLRQLEHQFLQRLQQELDGEEPGETSQGKIEGPFNREE